MSGDPGYEGWVGVSGVSAEATDLSTKNVPPADPTPAGTAPSGLSTLDVLGTFRPKSPQRSSVTGMPGAVRG